MASQAEGLGFKPRLPSLGYGEREHREDTFTNLQSNSTPSV